MAYFGRVESATQPGPNCWLHPWRVRSLWQCFSEQLLPYLEVLEYVRGRSYRVDNKRLSAPSPRGARTMLMTFQPRLFWAVSTREIWPVEALTADQQRVETRTLARVSRGPVLAVCSRATVPLRCSTVRASDPRSNSSRTDGAPCWRSWRTVRLRGRRALCSSQAAARSRRGTCGARLAGLCNARMNRDPRQMRGY